MSKYNGKIAIDLGTTNCVITHIDEKGEINIVPNKDGGTLTPSFIYMKQDKETMRYKYMVGSKAKEMIFEEPYNVVSSYKPHMGTKDIIKKIDSKVMTAQHCSMLMLRYLKQSAEKHLNQIISEAVITVPAYFTEAQKASTKSAAELAGLNVMQLLPEPSSAAYYYSKAEQDRDKLILVYDLGGGTFDISIVMVGREVNSVVAVRGDHYLGGDDIDKALAYKIFGKSYEKANQDNKDIMSKKAELAKIDLSSQYSKQPKADKDKIITLVNYNKKNIKISYADLEDIMNGILGKTFNMIDTLIQEAGLDIHDIEEVILVGGSTKLKYVSEKLNEMSDWKVLDDKIDPDLAVGKGAGIYLKALLDNKENELINVTPMDIGIEMDDGTFSSIIQSGLQIPITLSKTFSNIRGDQDITLNLYEGTHLQAKENEKIGELIIEVPKGTNPGEYVFDVTIKVCKDGTLDCRASSQALKRTKRLKIKREYRDILDDMSTMSDIIDNDQDMNKQQSQQTKQTKPTTKPITKTSKTLNVGW